MTFGMFCSPELPVSRIKSRDEMNSKGKEEETGRVQRFMRAGKKSAQKRKTLVIGRQYVSLLHLVPVS